MSMKLGVLLMNYFKLTDYISLELNPDLRNVHGHGRLKICSKTTKLWRFMQSHTGLKKFIAQSLSKLEMSSPVKYKEILSYQINPKVKLIYFARYLNFCALANFQRLNRLFYKIISTRNTYGWLVRCLTLTMFVSANKQTLQI